MAATPGESLPNQCKQNKNLAGAYRILNNPRADPHLIQQPHRELTYQACAQHRVVLCSQDTTEMDFRVFNLKPDPTNEVTWANRDIIQVRDLDGLCAPWMDH